MDNVTNIYEEMLVKVFKEYITKILTVTDKTLFTELKKNIEKALIENQIQNFPTLKSFLQPYMEEQVYYGKGHMCMFSYGKNNVQQKYKKYTESSINILNQEFDEIRKASFDAPLPLSTEILYTTGVGEIDNLFNRLIYQKIQMLIQDQEIILEFKIENDNLVHVLLISAELEYYVPYRE